MGQTVIWVHKGPQAGKILQVSDEEAAQAEKEGWGQITRGRHPFKFAKKTPGPHKEAEAFLARRGQYQTTEMKPAGEDAEAKPVSRRSAKTK